MRREKGIRVHVEPDYVLCASIILGDMLNSSLFLFQYQFFRSFTCAFVRILFLSTVSFLDQILFDISLAIFNIILLFLVHFVNVNISLCGEISRFFFKLINEIVVQAMNLGRVIDIYNLLYNISVKHDLYITVTCTRDGMNLE